MKKAHEMPEGENPLLDIVSAWQGRGGGADPRYDDRFAELRSEVEKLSGNDFDKIMVLSRAILRDQSLDLRVLAYASLAQVFQGGASGLDSALQGWCWVLENAWDECHPLRVNARVGALEWLNSDRFASYLKNNETSLESLDRLDRQLQRFYGLLDDRLDEAPRLRSVNEWIKRTSKTLRPADEMTAGKAGSLNTRDAVDSFPPSREGHSPSSAPGSSLSGIDNEQTEQKTVRALLARYRQEEKFEPMVRLSRGMRWSGLATPAADNGRTRIPPPRSASLNAVWSAMELKQWAEVLLASERAFLEPGGQYCLLLQHASYQAAGKLGDTPLADYISRELRALLLSKRELASLHYSDGSPFLGSTAINWVEGLLDVESGSPGDQIDHWSRVAEDAAAISQEKGLVAGLRVLDGIPLRGRKARAEQDLLKADLCLQHQRQELALPLLEDLAERLEDHGIAVWEPAFALRVWRLLQQALRAQPQSEEIQRQLDQVSTHINRTDITAAAAML